MYSQHTGDEDDDDPKTSRNLHLKKPDLSEAAKRFLYIIKLTSDPQFAIGLLEALGRDSDQANMTKEPSDSASPLTDDPLEGTSPPSVAKDTSVPKAPKKTLTRSELMHKLKPVLDSLPVDKLKVLSENADPDQFVGYLEQLYAGDNNVEVLEVVDSLIEDNLPMETVSAMLQGAILKKGDNPTESLPKDQDFTQSEAPQRVGDDNEELVEELTEALNDVSLEDLGPVLSPP